MDIMEDIGKAIQERLMNDIKVYDATNGEIIYERNQKATEQEHEQVKRLLSDVLSLLKIQEDYINFLSEYANKHSEYLRVHGITPTKEELEKGKSMRDTAKIYGKKVFEDGKLIERVKIKTLNG